MHAATNKYTFLKYVLCVLKSLLLQIINSSFYNTVYILQETHIYTTEQLMVRGLARGPSSDSSGALEFKFATF